MTAASGADREPVSLGAVRRSPNPSPIVTAAKARTKAAVDEHRARASGADQPTLRDQLAEALANARPWLESWDELPEVLRDQFRISVDALLPVIEADRERAKAEVWDSAALSMERIGLKAQAAAFQATAAALRGKTA